MSKLHPAMSMPEHADDGSPSVDAHGAAWEWQIWHTYSTYCLFPIKSVADAGRAFVDSGLAVVALSSSGDAWWSTGGRTVAARLEETEHQVGMSAKGVMSGYAATVSMTTKDVMSAYAQTCLRTGIRMEMSRRRIMRGDSGNPPSYVRAFLEPMTLTLAAGYRVLLYPQVLLDSSGIILTEFRSICPEGGGEIEEIIDERVNLFAQPCTGFGVQRAALRWFLRGIVGPVHGWRRRHWDRVADTWVQQLETGRRESLEDDFGTSLIQLPESEAQSLRRPLDVPIGLRFLAHTAEIATHAAVLAREEVLGRTNARRHAREFPLGAAWSGRPAVYLMWTPDQPVSASVRVRARKADLAKISVR